MNFCFCSLRCTLKAIWEVVFPTTYILGGMYGLFWMAEQFRGSEILVCLSFSIGLIVWMIGLLAWCGSGSPTLQLPERPGIPPYPRD